MPRRAPACCVLLLISSIAARAAEVAFIVTDQTGRPVADAVVSLAKAESRKRLANTADNASRAVIDQQNMAFAPLVSVVRRGGAVEFTNDDRVRHHVYSFAPVKRFEFVLNPGETSRVLKFAESGVAAIGCNIHDNMLAYVYVTDAPWSAVTDAEGRATIAGVAEGGLVARAWHPRLTADGAVPDQTISVAVAGQAVSFVLPLTAERSDVAGHRRNY